MAQTRLTRSAHVSCKLSACGTEYLQSYRCKQNLAPVVPDKYSGGSQQFFIRQTRLIVNMTRMLTELRNYLRAVPIRKKVGSV